MITAEMAALVWAGNEEQPVSKETLHEIMREALESFPAGTHPCDVAMREAWLGKPVAAADAKGE